MHRLQLAMKSSITALTKEKLIKLIFKLPSNFSSAYKPLKAEAYESWLSNQHQYLNKKQTAHTFWSNHQNVLLLLVMEAEERMDYAWRFPMIECISKSKENGVKSGRFHTFEVSENKETSLHLNILSFRQASQQNLGAFLLPWLTKLHEEANLWFLTCPNQKDFGKRRDKLIESTIPMKNYTMKLDISEIWWNQLHFKSF